MGSYGGCRAICAAPCGPREEARQCPFDLPPGFRAFGRVGEARRQHTNLWRSFGLLLMPFVFSTAQCVFCHSIKLDRNR